MNGEKTSQAATSSLGRTLTPLRFALRELRGTRRGFAVFLGCLIVGVMAIAGIGSFAGALTDGLHREGRIILGGDLDFTLVQRQATPAERTFMQGFGAVSEVAQLRAMARTTNDDATLVELKAVDGAYPLVGKLDLAPPMPETELLGEQNGIWGAAADDVLLTRLNLAPGSRIQVGNATFEIRSRLVSEPDALSSGIGFGARLLVSSAALEATGLVQPGSLVRWSYRLRLPDESAQMMDAASQLAHAELEQGGFQIRTRDNASPQLERNVDRIAQFLTLVALTSLMVGGVGVANGVSSHLAARREVIATMKAMGASRRVIFTTYGIEILLIALLGIIIGLALGAALPFVASAAIASLIPFPLSPVVDWAALGLAALYGLLVAAAFTVWPLAAAQEAPVSVLFRDGFDARRPRPGPFAMVLSCLLGLALALVAMLSADVWRTAALFLAVAAAVFILLRLVAMGVMAIARRLPRPKMTMARLALGNIHRPGALTPTVVLSLGLGLTLLVAITLIDRSLSNELNGPLQEEAPSFFFVDVPSASQEEFHNFISSQAPDATYRSVPMLRGRITHLAGRPAEEVQVPADAAWVLQSDRGISMSDTLPEGSTLVAGEWWQPGETRPLISFDEKLAGKLGLKLGDTITVNVLGRNITATIANLRQVKWERLNINFVMVFSPGTFAGAPHSVLSTLTWPGGADTAQEVALLKAVAQQFPAITSVRVKETLEQAAAILGQLSLGIHAASVITLLTSVLVLAGALAAGHQHRVYDAVVLKTLGATRARLLGAYMLEYAALGLVTAVFAVGAGTLAAWGVATFVMEIGFVFSPFAALGAVAGALVLTVGFGLLGTFRALGQAPARVLRHL